MISRTPTKSLRRVWFCTLAGLELAKLEDGMIHGKWNCEVHKYYGPKNRYLVEEFVNWRRGPEDVLVFTKRYGPLWPLTPGVEPTSFWAPAGGEFSFSVRDWCQLQDRLRSSWDLVLERGVKSPIAPWLYQKGNHDELAYEHGRFEFRTPILEVFLRLELLSCSPQRLKKCGKPGCETPYFVARHLGQIFCNDNCAKWAQAQHKKKWWEEHGSEWRKGQTARKKTTRK